MYTYTETDLNCALFLESADEWDKLAQVSKWIVYKWYSAVWVIAYNSLPFESISCVKSTLLIRPVFMFREPAEPSSFSPSLAPLLSLAFVLNYWGTAVCTGEA